MGVTQGGGEGEQGEEGIRWGEGESGGKRQEGMGRPWGEADGEGLSDAY